MAVIINEQQISKTSYLYLKTLASRCGIDLDEYQEQALYNRLIRRVRALNLDSFDAYCSLLRVDIEEEIKFINLITNSTTSFFRENHHFEYLAKQLLPELSAKQNKIRIWSAGCSTGEEPYSIAMVVYESIPHIQNLDLKILATDINSDALLKAQEGTYDYDSIKSISEARQKRWFDKINNPEGMLFTVKPVLKKIITFNKLNLMDNWPITKSFDIIFCRNVIIYFKQDISLKILSKFNRLLNKDGVLILGHSENLHELRKHYMSLGKTIYRKA